MKLKELRELNGRDCVYIGNTQELVEDIDRASNEAYEAGVKNGKAAALLTIKADEESARQEGYRSGYAAAHRISTDIRSVEQKVEALRVELNKRIDGLNKRIDGLEDFKHTHEGRIEYLEELQANPPLTTSYQDKLLLERIEKLESGLRDAETDRTAWENRVHERTEALEKRQSEYNKLIQDNISARVAIHNRVQELEGWRVDHGKLPHESQASRVGQLERRANEHTKAINGQLERLEKLEAALRALVSALAARP